MRAFIFHIEGFIKAERAGIEQIFFVAFGAFQAKDTVAFCSFFVNAHVNYKFRPAQPAGLNEFLFIAVRQSGVLPEPLHCGMALR